MEVNSLRQETECKRGRPILSDDAGLPQNSAQSHKLFTFFLVFVYNRFLSQTMIPTVPGQKNTVARQAVKVKKHLASPV